MIEKKLFIEYTHSIQLEYEYFDNNDEITSNTLDDLMIQNEDQLNYVENQIYTQRYIYYEKSRIVNLKPGDYLSYRVVYTDLEECHLF